MKPNPSIAYIIFSSLAFSIAACIIAYFAITKIKQIHQSAPQLIEFTYADKRIAIASIDWKNSTMTDKEGDVYRFIKSESFASMRDNMAYYCHIQLNSTNGQKTFISCEAQ